ncbi:hypothetical protein [Paenimyroides tangerinum]|nr:hypothetical protein [Paenimyroides tangerinum]
MSTIDKKHKIIAAYNKALDNKNTVKKYIKGGATYDEVKAKGIKIVVPL